MVHLIEDSYSKGRLLNVFLADFQRNGHGYLLNVASVAGFLPGGPLLSTYYATKSYVLSL